jgi:capsule polysaccharide export protein KpsE/RkpR
MMLMSKTSLYFSTLFGEEFYTQVDVIIGSPHPDSALSFGSFGEYFPQGSRTFSYHNRLLDDYIRAEKTSKHRLSQELQNLGNNLGAVNQK